VAKDHDQPTLDKAAGIHDRPPKGEPGYVPCWWSRHGTTDPTHPERANIASGCEKYRENYDEIRWDK